MLLDGKAHSSSASAKVLPATGESLVNQIEQLVLGSRVHTTRLFVRPAEAMS